MRAVVFTLGCKVNDVESGSLIRGLEGLGFEVSRTIEKADLYILNTCAVTGEAERKSRQTVGKLQKLNPEAKIIVCGCASEKSPQDFLDKNVYAVFGAKRKGKILELAKEGFSAPCGRSYIEDCGRVYEDLPTPECLKTRNFVKIQDGCDRFCSYCVIPYLRGRNRSRDADDSAREILESTAFETVITGIDISAYKDERGRDLADLLLLVKNAKTRIRLGSIEVSLITERFISAVKQVKNFAPQFHLSLQSGSNSVLKSMNRHYTREEYLEKCKMLYKAFPNASITTDVIVGFPTETEEDFIASLDIVTEAGFSQIHAFPYSPREGTNAYKKYKELPASVKKERVERILARGAEQKQIYLKKYLNQALTIVPENVIDGYTEGYSENYLRLYVKGDIGKHPIQVRVLGLFKEGLLCSVNG